MIRRGKMPDAMRCEPHGIVQAFLAQWEGFEFEKAIFYGVNSCHFRLSAPFLRYIASFCTLPHIRLKGENKGENRVICRPPAAGVAEIRRTSSGAAAPCGRPGGLLQPPGRRGSGTRPAVLLRPVGVLATSFSCQGRRGSGTRPAVLLRPVGGLAASFSRRG